MCTSSVTLVFLVVTSDDTLVCNQATKGFLMKFKFYVSMAWMHDFNDNMQLKLFNLRQHANLNMTKV